MHCLWSCLISIIINGQMRQSPVALPGRYKEMNQVLVNAKDCEQGLMAMPPLLKGYLRLGGVVVDGAVVDYNFGTMDVRILVERCGRMERCVERYMDG